ncbi:MAG: FAD:protein FMN transferase [Desulfobulbaceae bacterium]|nr:FAD:protein FMN transferase [Desulfobulbaceae bacterium]
MTSLMISNILRTLLLLLLLLPAPAACRQEAGSGTISRKLDVFGTIVEITIRDTDPRTANRAMEAVRADFARMHRDWHAWKPGELTRLNAALAEGRSFQASPFLLPLVRQAKTFWLISDGLFDPAIGAIIGAWGFHADELPKGTRPPLERIRKLVALHPSMGDVQLEDDVVSSRNRTVQLDFGGFAKGEAVDRAIQRLREFGIRNAIVNAGGDLKVIGSHGDRPWRAGIRDPKDWGVIATVELASGEALFTSGNYERYREYEGIRYAHIIDPRTGMPVEHIVSATVLHANGALADAAATALVVAGPQDWMRIAKRMGVQLVMLVDDAGTVYLTPEMRRRVVFVKKPKRLVVAK